MRFNTSFKQKTQWTHVQPENAKVRLMLQMRVRLLWIIVLRPRGDGRQ